MTGFSATRIEYQDTAVNELMNHVANTTPTVSLVAPTGSGKTVMTAQFIERAYEQARFMGKPFLAVWFCFGTELPEQSRKKVSAHLGEKVRCLDSSNLNANGIRPQDGDIWFFNWEKLNGSDRKLRGDSPDCSTTVDDLFSGTDDFFKLVIVDEAHYHDSVKSDGIVSVVNPTFLLGVTATPTKKSKAKYMEQVTVTEANVRDSGMLKKTIVLNPDYDDSDGMLANAWNKLEEIRSVYREVGSSVIPLMLIQVPNETAAKAAEFDVYAKRISDFCAATEGVVARAWTQGDFPGVQRIDESELANIASNKNTVNILVFKQKASTGWDCPRAHILVKFREPAKVSEVFDAQVLGRIRRTSERKHYGNDILDFGYLYTDHHMEAIDKALDTNNTSGLNRGAVSKMFPVTVFPLENLSLPYWHRKSGHRNRSNFTSGEFETFKKLFLGMLEKHGESIVSSVRKVGTSGDGRFLATGRLDTFGDANLGKSEYGMSRGEVSDLIKFGFANALRSKNTDISSWAMPLMRETKEFLRNAIGADGSKLDSYLLSEMKLGDISAVYVAIKDFQEAVFERMRKDSIGDITTEGGTGDNAVLAIYKGMPDKNGWPTGFKTFGEKNGNVSLVADTEIPFAEFLCASPNVKWWLKNGDSGKNNFSIPYESSEGIRRFFYPDFVVGLSDGRIGIFDTKGVNSTALKEEFEPSAKSDALLKYIAALKNVNGMESFGGIVVSFKGNWKIWEEVRYSTDFGEWKNLSI